MLGISQTCNQPCNHKHNHQSKGDKVVKKQIKSLIKNQSNEWIVIEQEVKQKFIKLKKQLTNLQRQIFSDIQKLKQKQALSQVKLTKEQLSKINKIMDEKYEQVSCKQLTELLKLAKSKSKKEKTKDSKSIISKSIVSNNKSRFIKSKDQKKKNSNIEDSISSTILNQSYLQIKTDIFQNIDKKLKALINSQQQYDFQMNSSHILDLEDKEYYQNQSFFSKQSQIQDLKQRLNQINDVQDNSSIIQNYTANNKQIKKQEVNQETQNSYKDYIEMKKRESGKNIKWALQTQKQQKEDVIMNKRQVKQKQDIISMKKKQRRFDQEREQKIREKIKQTNRQQEQQQEQYNFQSISVQQLQRILKYDEFPNNRKAEIAYQQLQSSIQQEDNTYLQKQQQDQQKQGKPKSFYLEQAPQFDLQQYQKQLQQQIIRQSILSYQRQNGKQKVNMNPNINSIPRISQRLIPSRQNQTLSLYNLLRAMNPTNPLLKKKYTSINQLQQERFKIVQSRDKFDILIKVIRPVQLTVVKTVQKSYLKIKFIGADEQSMAIFYTNYDPKIKKGACILLQNCQLNQFKNQYQIACKFQLKPQNFLPSNAINVRVQSLNNTFSRIRRNHDGQLQYSVPSSEQMKLSQCVKTYYRNSNQIKNILLNFINPFRINKQVIVCILSRGQQRDCYVIGDYSGRVYAKLPFQMNSAIGDTIMLICPIIYIESDVYGRQKIFLHAQKILNLQRIGFQFDKSQIPNFMLSKDNVQ